MFKALGGILSALFGSSSASAGTSIVSQGLSIAAEKVVDVDKLVGLISSILIKQIETENNPGWVSAMTNLSSADARVQRAVAFYIRVDASHKAFRTFLWVGVMVTYVTVSIVTKQPMDFETLALLSAGPGLYTVFKGAGRK